MLNKSGIKGRSDKRIVNFQLGVKRSNPQAAKILVLQIVNKSSVVFMCYFFIRPSSIRL